MAASNPIVNLIVQGARARGLDPAAVLAVASQEGLSGRIGDGGHAYGPFQLNNAGGVITGTHPGVNDAATQAWASSPTGINFALDRIAGVARGLHGQQAVNAIVTQFERPANPGREVAGANAAYGSYSGGAAQAVLPPGAPQQPAQAVPARPTPGSNTLAILNEGARLFGLPPLPAVPTSAPIRAPKAAAAAVPASPMAQPPTFLSGSNSYVHPLTGATIGRLDQGIDYQGKPGQHVVAVGNARVDAVKSDPNGFGVAIYYTLLDGPDAGRQVYVGHAAPNVKTGEVVRAGQPVATLLQHPLGNATQPGWTEIGFASNGVPTSTAPGDTRSARQFLSFVGGTR